MGMNDQQKAFLKKHRGPGANIQLCCDYIKDPRGVHTACGHLANYRKSWSYCPFCGKPIAVLFNDDNMQD